MHQELHDDAFAEPGAAARAPGGAAAP
ncbi:hypothetical protein HaLaN_29868, partial [Haematococcus lacustris]